MSVIVFIGPTLKTEQAAQYLKADYRPPAKQGDVYRVCLEKPKVIAIIDGYFESIPAVWHKEILYAMSQGIHVFGAGSMGALRAAELDVFGMQGIGEVYRRYRSAELEDDDEVAVVHGPKEMSYIGASDAMVNIRVTLEAAQQYVLTPEQAMKLLEAAKQTWYPNRSFSHLLEQAKDILPATTHAALSQFISQQKIDIKRQDAIELLQHLTSNIDVKQLPAMQVDYAFVKTDAWETMVEAVENTLLHEQNDIDIEALVLELKLSGLYPSLVAQARERQTALNRVTAMAGDLSGEELKSALVTFAKHSDCVVNGKIDFDRLADWLKSRRLDMQGFDLLVKKQGKLARLETACPDFLEPLLDIIRLNSPLTEFYQSIEFKQQAASKNLNETLIDDTDLWSWYFQTYLNIPLPIDLSVYAEVSGFGALGEMRRAVTAHYDWFFAEKAG